MLYVYLVTAFNKLFFPPGHEALSFCLLWVVFGLSCLMRPVGSYLFGLMADKINADKAQKYSILLMGASSIALAVLPGYGQIGWLAVVLLLLIRCLQVGCASAQFTLSIFSLVDTGTREPKGRSLVIPQLYSTVGILIAGVVMLMNQYWLHISMDYYWRFAYALNVFFVAAYYLLLRFKQYSKPALQVKVVSKKGDFAEVLAQWRPMLLLALAMLMGFSFVYVCVILYLPTYLTSVLHYNSGFDVRALFYCHVVIACSLYFYSKIYDYLLAWVRNALLLVPLLMLSTYSVLMSYSVSNVLIVLCVSSLLYAPYSFSIMRAMLIIFPEHVRNRCGGVAYNIGVAISSLFPMLLSHFVSKYHMQGFSYFFFFMSLAAFPVFLLLMKKVKVSLAGNLQTA